VERVLLEKIREGDNEAFAQLYEKYAEYALRVAMAVTRDKMSAAVCCSGNLHKNL
jgi:hypothetical protein